MVPRRQFVQCGDVESAIICSLCHDAWDLPVELQPCGHIFCGVCYNDYTSSRSASTPPCPTCSTPVNETWEPNRLLVNKSSDVQVRCVSCDWTGKREQSRKHMCPMLNFEEIETPPLTTIRTRRIAGNGVPNTNNNTNADAQDNAMRNSNSRSDNSSNRTPVGGYANANSSNTEGYTLSPAWWQNGNDEGRERASLPHSPLTSIQTPPTQQQQTQQQIQQATRMPTQDRPWVKYNLTQEEYDQMMGIFIFFDSTGNGSMREEEMHEMFSFLHYTQDRDESRRIFLQIDRGGRGRATFDDLLLWMSQREPNPDGLYGMSLFEYNSAVMQFLTYDAERKGSLTWSQFRELCRSNGYAKSDAEAWSLFLTCCDSTRAYVDKFDFLHTYKRLYDARKAKGRTSSSNTAGMDASIGLNSSFDPLKEERERRRRNGAERCSLM